MSSYSVYNKSNHKLENLTSKEYIAFINLAENDYLIIQKADKGNNVVILNRQDYIEKMEEILSDKTFFKTRLHETYLFQTYRIHWNKRPAK